MLLFYASLPDMCLIKDLMFKLVNKMIIYCLVMFKVHVMFQSSSLFRHGLNL